MNDHDQDLSLDHIERCFGGAIPAVLATASGDGVVNVTFVSRAHQVDAQRIALSNQFMSKTSRNLVSNPRASLLLTEPVTHDQYRLALRYERTERRGPVFERLRSDIDALAVLENMQDVYRLRSADVFRVESIEHCVPNPSATVSDDVPEQRAPEAALAGLAELARHLARAGDLDTVVDTTLDGLDRLLDYHHTMLLLLDEERTRLYSIGSHGFDQESVGAEVVVGHGQIGLAAERCEPLRIGGLHQMRKYARALKQRHVPDDVGPGHVMPLPAVAGVQSRIVVPAVARGELVGVLVAESRRPVAFTAADEQVLGVVATLIANAVEHVRGAVREESDDTSTRERERNSPLEVPEPRETDGPLVKFFTVDGSVFVDGDYLIKGVAGRILWTLLSERAASGRTDFTNRELRLDPTLDLPGFKDNLESRLILLKRRLDERAVPIRIDKTGRGRFHLTVTSEPRLESVQH